MRDNVEYFFASLDFHLAHGDSPAIALESVVEDYARVYAVKDHRTELQRAASVALDRIAEEEVWKTMGGGEQ